MMSLKIYETRPAMKRVNVSHEYDGITFVPETNNYRLQTTNKNGRLRTSYHLSLEQAVQARSEYLAARWLRELAAHVS
jgi:hypothetical protein